MVIVDIIQGPSKGARLTYEKPDCLLMGRSAEAGISIQEDPFLSRHHLVIEIAPPRCKITDLDSKNGFLVGTVQYGGKNAPPPGVQTATDGQKGTFLKNGDIITVGDTKLQVRIQGEEAQKSAPAADRPTDEDAPRPKLRIKGYSIKREIRSDNTSRTYLAEDARDNRLVAIKEYAPTLAVNGQKGDLLKHEINKIKKLVHKNIVRLHKFGKHKDLYVFIYDYFDGYNLEEITKDFPNGLDLEIAAPMMVGLLEGLAYAHQIKTGQGNGKEATINSIVHRDLTPDNILLAKDGHAWVPKITNFGLCKSIEASGLSDITGSGQLLGNPVYWPREQITHFNYLYPATDVFSIAAVFYKMLSGALMRDGFDALFKRCRQAGRTPSIADYMRVICKNKTIPIRERKQNIPPELAKVIDRALLETEQPPEKKKIGSVLGELRYADAGKFLDALKASLKKNSIDYKKTVDLPHDFGEVEDSVSRPIKFQENTILHSTATASTEESKALMVIDLVKSTELLLSTGDTFFSNLIVLIYNTLKKHESSADLFFLKCTGDGFFAVYDSIPAAFSILKEFQKKRNELDVGIRVVLHWGKIKSGPGGDPLGKEVHKVFRIESIKDADYIGDIEKQTILPENFRIVASEPAIKKMEAPARKKFTLIGDYRLKGFSNPQKIWLTTNAV